MGNSLYLDRAERPRLEFGLLRLNFTDLTFINNDTFSVAEKTQSFTSHGAIAWKGSFFSILEETLQETIDNLGSLLHPLFHYASIIIEDENRIFMTPDEKAKLLTVENNANNYSHPASHSLSMIEETVDRKIFSSVEKNKLNNISTNANKYEHPESHSMDDIDGLLDAEGFLTPLTPSYLYSDNRHFLPKEINVSLGSTEWILDNVNKADAVLYTGNNSSLSIPFRFGFNDNINHGLYIFLNSLGTFLFNSFSNDRLSLKNGKNICDKALTISNSDNVISANVKDYINYTGNQTCLGFRFNESVTLDAQLWVKDWYTLNKFRFIRKEEMSTTDINTCFRLFFIENGITYYISRRYPGSYYEVKEAETNNVVELISLYHSNHYLYKSNPSPDGYSEKIFVQYTSSTSGVSFRVFYKLKNQTIQNTSFVALKTSSTTYKHSDNEIVKEIVVSPFIVTLSGETWTAETEHAGAVADNLMLFILSNNGTNSWITIYKITLSTKSLTLYQTLSFNYLIEKMDCVANKAPMWYGYVYSNLLCFHGNGNIYIYSREFSRGGGNFVLRHTVSASALPTVYNIRKILFYDQSTIIFLGVGEYFLLRLISSTPTILDYYIPTSTASNPYYADKYTEAGFIGNVVPCPSTNGNMFNLDYRNSGFFVEKHILAIVSQQSNSVTSVDLILPLDNRRYRLSTQSKTDQPAPQTTVGIGYDPGTLYPIIYLGQSTKISKYHFGSLRSFINSDLGFMSWDYSFDSKNPIIDYPNGTNKLPIVIFCYHDSTRRAETTNDGRKFIMIYNNKQYTVEEAAAPIESQTGFYGLNQPLEVSNSNHTNVTLKYVNPYDSANAMTADTFHGNDYMYFGFFGDTYFLKKNGIDSGVKGKKGKTCIVELSPGDVLDVEFIPNLILFRRNTLSDTLNLSGQTSLFSGYSDFQYSPFPILTTNDIFEVSNSFVTLKDTVNDSYLFIIVGAEGHPQSSDFSIQASPLEPLFASMYSGANNLGEVDTNFIKTENITPIAPINLSPVDSKYLALNRFGDITYNGMDGIMEWEKPDEILFFDTNATKFKIGNSPYLYLPIAKVNFIDDVITKVISYPNGDLYIVDWFEFDVGTPAVLDNRFMSLGIMIKVMIKSDSGEIFNNDTLINNGVKVSFDHEFINIYTSEGQTYILENDSSCQLKLIIKRLF